MSVDVIVAAVRRERADLALRWLGQFSLSRASAGLPEIAVDEELILALLDDMVTMLAPDAEPTRRIQQDRSVALARLAGFPDSIALTIDLLQAGVQVIGAYAVENAGPCAAWSIRARNRFLGELDAVFPLLVRRDVSALCDRYLPGPTPSVADVAREMFSLPEWARAIALRN